MSDEASASRSLPDSGPFGELDAETRARLAAAGKFEVMPNGSAVAVQGEPHKTLSVVVDGKVAISCHAHGDTVHLADLGTGETVWRDERDRPRPSSANAVVSGGPASSGRSPPMRSTPSSSATQLGSQISRRSPKNSPAPPPQCRKACSTARSPCGTTTGRWISGGPGNRKKKYRRNNRTAPLRPRGVS
ncbi:MAG: hypothetical protein R3F11_29895 [Verrucomicrobiales bacterium]